MDNTSMASFEPPSGPYRTSMIWHLKPRTGGNPKRAQTSGLGNKRFGDRRFSENCNPVRKSVENLRKIFGPMIFSKIFSENLREIFGKIIGPMILLEILKKSLENLRKNDQTDDFYRTTNLDFSTKTDKYFEDLKSSDKECN